MVETVQMLFFPFVENSPIQGFEPATFPNSTFIVGGFSWPVHLTRNTEELLKENVCGLS